MLKELSFTVSPGERVGVVGRTGAGKSSLIAALFRMEKAAAGSILVGGQDIGKLSLEGLRKVLSLVPQDPVLMVGSIRENLDPEEACSDDEIVAMLKSVNVLEAVEKKGGLEGDMSEGGDNFSVGERQLLSLSRALLRKDSKVLMLDEATSSVDADTDMKVQSTLRNVLGGAGKTVLTIAHRVDTIMDYDKILALSDGHVVEFGSPSELLANPEGVFSQLVNRDSGGGSGGGGK